MKHDNEECEVDEVDLEDEAKAGRKPKKARRYRLRIDKDKYVSDREILTGREILALAGKTTEKFVLTQKIHKGGTVQIAPDQKVDLREKGIERFMTLAKDATDGDRGRVEFALQPRDVESLDALGLNWEAIKDGAVQWILIHGFPVPTGYNAAKATLALQLVPQYPDQQIDMANFSPALSLASGRPLKAVSPRLVAGVNYQQWSRHRTAANPWKVGVDDLGTHIELVKSWLLRELP